jgi:hypothetical protein
MDRVDVSADAHTAKVEIMITALIIVVTDEVEGQYAGSSDFCDMFCGELVISPYDTSRELQLPSVQEKVSSHDR